MNKNLVWVAVVVVAIIALAGVFTPAGKTIVERTTEQVGSVVGPDIWNHMTFNQSFTKGGTQVATSSNGNITLSTAEFREEVSYISWTVNGNGTLTTMASTSAPLSNLKTGESLEVYLYNASTSASAQLTLAAGTGVDLQEDEGETVIVNGLEMARLNFIKKADNDVALWVEVAQVGD